MRLHLFLADRYFVVSVRLLQERAQSVDADFPLPAFGVRQLAAAFDQASLLAVARSYVGIGLAGPRASSQEGKAAASCRSPNDAQDASLPFLQNCLVRGCQVRVAILLPPTATHRL